MKETSHYHSFHKQIFRKKREKCRYQLALRVWVTAATYARLYLASCPHHFTKREMEWSTTLRAITVYCVCLSNQKSKNIRQNLHTYICTRPASSIKLQSSNNHLRWYIAKVQLTKEQNQCRVGWLSTRHWFCTKIHYDNKSLRWVISCQIYSELN